MTLPGDAEQQPVSLRAQIAVSESENFLPPGKSSDVKMRRHEQGQGGHKTQLVENLQVNSDNMVFKD